jgi:hypothetical protein
LNITDGGRQEHIDYFVGYKFVVVVVEVLEVHQTSSFINNGLRAIENTLKTASSTGAAHMLKE